MAARARVSVAVGLVLLSVGLALPAQETPAPEAPPPQAQEAATPAAPGAVAGHSEVVVTPTLTARDPFTLPTAVTVENREAIQRAMPFSVLDALGDHAGIWVEKRTNSTSDPVIRGLAGSNLLALVDGNTLSTFWGEGGDGGDDMYGKVAAENVERVEVVRGPRSVLYGSNALGGVIHFLTRSCPYPFPESGSLWGTEVRTGGASAAEEARYRQEFFGATPRFRFILGASLKSSGNVRRGGGFVQVPTSSHEHNWDFKGEWRLPAGLLTLSLQDVNRRGVHRYYRPLQNNDNDRTGLSLEYASRTALPLWDRSLVKVYYQDKEDLRRWWDSGAVGVAKTETWALQGRAEKGLGDHLLTYGLSYELDLGEDADDEQFTTTAADGTVEKAAPDTRWHGLGLFLQDEWAVAPRWRLTYALRADQFLFCSYPDEYYHPAGGWDPEQDRLRERKTSLVGSAGVIYSVTPELSLLANYGRGYRLWAPQFGVTQRGVGVVVPSGLLDPVVGDTFEVGLKRAGAAWELSAFAYWTRFDNWQTVVPSTFAGSDWYDFNGNGVRDLSESVYVTASVGSAWVRGVEVEGLVRLEAFGQGALKGWTLGGGAAANRGRVETLDEPLRHTQPPVLKLFAEWSRPDLKYEPYVRLGAECAGRYDEVADEFLTDDPGYRVDPQDGSSPLVRPYGLPGYSTFNLRAGMTISRRVGLRLSVDNLTDKLYRRAHSRWDESGLNAALMVRVTLGD